MAEYSEEAPTISGVYYHSYAYHYFLALVELISRLIQIFGEPRALPSVLFMTEALNKAILCRLFSVRCKEDAGDYEQNTP